jgi:hypothetical protein
MALADDFQAILDTLPPDWTDLELDLRVEESKYIEAAVLLVICNPQPYSEHDWHWRLIVAHEFGHATSWQATHAALRALDRARIKGQLVLRELRAGRVEVEATWGRPASAVSEMRRIRGQ